MTSAGLRPSSTRPAPHRSDRARAGAAGSVAILDPMAGVDAEVGQPNAQARESALVAAAKRGDAAAFDHLVHLHSPTMYRTAFRIVGSGDADDVVQEAWISTWHRIADFREEARLSTYLYRVTVNTALMQLRRARRMHPLPVDETLPDDSERQPEPSMLRTLSADALHEAVRGLPVEQRLAVVLRDFEGLAYAEAAAILDISVPALKSRLHRGRNNLAHTMSDWK